MTEIIYYDRQTQSQEKEKVYGQFFLQLLYGQSLWSKLCSWTILPLFAHISLLSRLYGSLQKSRSSRSKIEPFIQHFHVDASEFLEPVSSFHSFNDFFIRHLKPECRPINPSPNIAVMPADARYLVFPKIDAQEGIWVKGKNFSLSGLLQSKFLAEQYAEGSMVIARLCPVDYHRFHFPCECLAGEPKQINGPLYSVNPIALKRNISILSENKRVITELYTQNFGRVLYIEVGATYVGAIHQTYTPNSYQTKGAEKGYFSFGGSCLILLFEKDKIVFDQDLIEHSAKKTEVRALFGQSLGMIPKVVAI